MSGHMAGVNGWHRAHVLQLPVFDLRVATSVEVGADHPVPTGSDPVLQPVHRSVVPRN